MNCGSSRCFGYYETFEEADKAVRENRCDIREYLYDYCFIENIPSGIHPICLPEDRHLYEYDETTDSFVKIDEPVALHHIVGWALG